MAMLGQRPLVSLCRVSLWVILFACDFVSGNVTMFGGASKSAPKKSASKTPKLPGEESPLKQPPAKEPAAKQMPANTCKPAVEKPAAKTQKDKLSEREATPKPKADDVMVPHAN